MLKLMIVDDEPATRRGLHHAIPWEKHGITVVAEADNGQTALRKTMQFAPDVILCDIRMPLKDGLAFARELRALMPRTRMILMTGYGSQEYMMQAIREHVDDFLIKPVTQEQILATVLRIKDELEKERQELRQLRGLEDYIAENQEKLREHFLTSLFTTRQTEGRIVRSLSSLSFSLPGPLYSILMLRGAPGTWYMLSQQCQKAFAFWQPILYLQQDLCIVTVLLQTKEAPETDTLEKTLKELEGYIYGGCVYTKPVPALSQLCGQYEACLQWSLRNLYFDRGTLLCATESEIPFYDEERILAQEKSLLQAAQDGFWVDVDKRMNEYWNMLIEMKPPNTVFAERINHVIELVALLSHAPSGEMIDAASQSIDEIQKEYFDVLTRVFAFENKYLDISVRRALKYMQLHYNENISLESVANDLCISPTYLSKLLNEKTEYGFYGWLRYFRLRAARHLLVTTDMKHYEIAVSVGYSSYKKFAEQFMETEGVSATQYRNLHRYKA